jgi:hypothetical protein
MTSVKQLIERATSEQLLSEDWDTNIAICDLLTQRPDDLYYFFL